MANVMLPRIVNQDNKIKNFLVRQGPNLPPHASRRRYSVLADGQPKTLPGIGVSSVAQKNSLENVDSGRGSSVQGYQDDRPLDSSLGKDSNQMLSISALRIEGYNAQRIQLDEDDDDDDWQDDDDDYIDDGSIDPSAVQWNDFNDQHVLKGNLDLFLSCKKVAMMKFDVAKPDFIDGVLVVPVFHCPKCLDCWNRTRNLPETCVEEAEPTRGKPIALDESANAALLDDKNINIIQVRERRKKPRRTKKTKNRRNTLTLAYGYDTVGVTRDSQANFMRDSQGNLMRDSQGNLIEGKRSNYDSANGFRKYGGLNQSEAEMFVKSSSSRLSKDKSKRSNYSDSGKGSFDSLDTSSSTGFQKKSKDSGGGMSLDSRLTRVVNAAVKAKKNGIDVSSDEALNRNDHTYDDKNGDKSTKHRGLGNELKGHGNELIDNNDSKRIGLISIDETNILNNIGKDIGDASHVGLLGGQSYDSNASPSEILAKMKGNRKTSSGYKNAGAMRKNSSFTNKNVGKQMLATAGGGGVQQLLETDKINTTAPDKKGNARKSSIPVGFDEQYLMQGNKERVQTRNSKIGSTKGDSVGMANIVTNTSTSTTSNTSKSSKINFRKTESGKIIPISNKQSDVMNSKLRGKTRRTNSSKDGRSSTNKNSVNGKVPRNNEFGLPPVERLKQRGSPYGSKELLSPRSSLNDSRSSSQSHLSCLDSFEELDNTAKPGRSRNKKMTAKERLYASLEMSRRKQSVFAKYDIFNNKQIDRVKEPIDRANLTPSPKLCTRLSKNDLMGMKMRQFTRNYTFSFFELPIQQKKFNDDLTRKMNVGNILTNKNSTRKKKK